MAYEIDNEGKENEVHRVTSPLPKGPAPINAKTAKGVEANSKGIYRDGHLVGLQFGAPSAEELAREQQAPTPLDGSIYRLQALTGEITVERPGQASAVDTTDRFPRLPETGQRVTDLASLSDTSVVVFGEDRKMPVREAILRGLMERDPYGRLKMSEPTAPAPAASAPAATSTKPLPVLLQTPSYGAVDLSRLQPLDAVLVNGQSMSVVECTVRGILKKAVDGRGYSLVS